MRRKAIMVTESNGQYHVAPNAEPEAYQTVERAANQIRVVEALQGWDYDWAIETDLGWFFVTGKDRPKAKIPF